VSLCRVCDQPAVWKFVWGVDTYEQFDDQRLYPAARDDTALPSRVQERLGEALRVKRIDAGFYAVAIGRVLETICNEEGASGRNLDAKLRNLATTHSIPGPLLEITDELRKLRNLGAHDDDMAVAHEDVPLIEALAESLLEYLYRGPARLAAIREALVEREAALLQDAVRRRAERNEPWTRKEILAQIKHRRGTSALRVAERLFAWVDKRGDLTAFYGSGKKDGSFQAGFDDEGRYLFPFALYGYGRIEVHFQYIKRQPAFAGESPRRELLSRLNKIAGVSIGEEMLDKRPSIPLEALVESEAFNRFTATLDWAFQRASDHGRQKHPN